MAEQSWGTGLAGMSSDQAEVAWQRVKEVCSEADPRPNPPAMDRILMPEYERELLLACQAAVAAGTSLKSSLPLILVLSKLLLPSKCQGCGSDLHWHRLSGTRCMACIQCPRRVRMVNAATLEAILLACSLGLVMPNEKVCHRKAL